MSIIHIESGKHGKPEGFLRVRDKGNKYKRGGENYDLILALLAVAEAFMSNKSERAQEHFIALVKEIEERFGFVFERVKEETPQEPAKRRFYCTSCKKEVPQHQVMPSLGLEKLFHIVNCDAAPGSGIVNEVPKGWGEEPKEKSPIFCEHANEMPAQCPCGPDCYCKEHSCKPKKHQVFFCHGCCQEVPREQVLVEPTYMQHFVQKGNSGNVKEICGWVEVRTL